jgi:hypothetical protein
VAGAPRRGGCKRASRDRRSAADELLLHDGNGHLYFEQRGSSDVRSEGNDGGDRDNAGQYSLHAGPIRLVSQILGATSRRESATFLYGRSGERLPGFSGHQSAYYITDDRASVRATTDTHGRPTSARTYDARGTR